MHSIGKHGHFTGRDLDFSADRARTRVKARLIMRGNGRLKVGEVSEKGPNTDLVDIVTVDDSLARRVEVDRARGLRQRHEHGHR